jgi:hypothetical protein
MMSESVPDSIGAQKPEREIPLLQEVDILYPLFPECTVTMINKREIFG